jgi:hypothetical protein
MRKETSKSSSSIRAIVPQHMLPVSMCTIHKQEMQMTLAQQELQSAKYQAKKQRYTQHQTVAPVFQEQTRTDTVQVQTISSVTSFSSKVASSSFSHVHERVMKQHSKTLLQKAPQSPNEWQYATRGIV